MERDMRRELFMHYQKLSSNFYANKERANSVGSRILVLLAQLRHGSRLRRTDHSSGVLDRPRFD